MKLPFTERFLWDLYKTAKFTAGALDKFCSARFRGTRGMVDFLKYPNYDDLKKLEEKRLGKQRFGRLIKYLKHNNYLHIKQEKNKNAVMLTPKGAQRILEIKTKIEGIPKRKDGKWEMIMFDIPEEIRNRRDYFRAGLKRLKYQRLQQSIWICPYDVLKETEELVKDLKLQAFVKILLLEEVKISK